MLRKLIAVLLSLSLCCFTVACGGNSGSQISSNTTLNVSSVQRQLTPGKYPVQQAEYDDSTGTYTLMLLNTPPGEPPVYQSPNLQMARLTDEAIAAGEKTYLEIEPNQSVMYLSEDFRIEYVHNVTETQTNPQTGQQETVIVRRESSFWTPFAGALAGQIVGNMLFAPRYYIPPVYRPGATLSGYGGYGNTYRDAVQSYQSRHDAPPAAVKNKQTLRSSGSVKRSSSSQTATKKSPNANSTKASGSGYGSSNLDSSRRTSPSRVNRRSTGFGSGSKSRSFSSSRRRR